MNQQKSQHQRRGFKKLLFGVVSFFVLFSVVIYYFADVKWDQQEKDQQEKTADEVKVIDWDDLIPEGYNPAELVEKYQPQIDALEDMSPEVPALLAKIQEELDNAPVNKELSGRYIKIPGYVVPLENDGERISSFLLVPYFGACIHFPPPPANQTILVNTHNGLGIRTEESWEPIWIKGRLMAKNTSTEMAHAGYYMNDAVIEVYQNAEGEALE